eukprot:INCI9764.1.p1 GENE.INCI9764.1~~INCI9764.1.p1  ORF type:complete len:349 (+),score=41.66 INCI9764.1:151-1197(+)
MGAEYSILAYIQWRRAGFKSYGHAGFAEASQRWARASFEPTKGHPHPNEMRDSLAGRNVVVTGANSGLGFCVAEELARRRATVHMVCRNEGRGEAARQRIISETGNKDVVLHICDVSSMESVRSFSQAFCRDVGELYCLVNNAGCMPPERQESKDGVELSLATMAGGTFLLTGLLLPALKKSEGGDARVINVSSAGMYSMIVNLDDLNSEKRSYDGARVYAIAKRIQCDLTKVWAEEVLGPEDGICVTSMHPGWAKTEGLETQYPSFYEQAKDMLRTPEQGADTAVWLACTSQPPRSGAFYFDREEHPTSFKFTGTESSRSVRTKTWNAFCDLFSWGRKLDIDALSQK